MNAADWETSMRKLLALLLMILTGCGTIYPIEPQHGPHSRVPRPVLPEASVNGPYIERFRLDGWSDFSSFGYATAKAWDNNGNQAWGSAQGSSFGSVHHYSYYQSTEAEDFLRKLLEDTNTVTRIF